MKKRKQNALVLGGGGAKGFAHIGAITFLEEHSLRPDIICGTSAGALAGAFYSLHGENIGKFKKIEDTREFAVLKELNLRNIDFEEEKQSVFLKTVSTIKAKFSMIKMLRDSSVLKEDDVVPVFMNLFRDIKFDELQIPLTCAAFDIISGRDVYIKTGPLWKGVLASCSIPGIFPPVAYGKMLLVDGGVTNRLPAKCAVLSGAKNILGIDLSNPAAPGQEVYSVVNLHLRIDALLANRFDMHNKFFLDMVLKPDIGDMKWHEFNRYKFAMEKGSEKAAQLLPEIKRIRSRTYRFKKGIRSFLRGAGNEKFRFIDSNEYLFV